MKTITIDDALHERIKTTAEKEDRTILKIVERAISDYIEKINVPAEQN